MAITEARSTEAYSAGASEERADRHRQQALDALTGGDRPVDALVHALLAIESRLDELIWHVAR